MLLLIGSRALWHWGRLQNRQPADWDFISPIDRSSEVVQGERAEFSHGTESDYIFYTEGQSTIKIDTPFGEAVVASLPALKAIKEATAPHLNKAKHMWDLQQLQDVRVSDVLHRAMLLRHAEIRKRVAKQKDEFFNKYSGVVQHIDHDWLHELINPSPMYLRTLTTATEASELMFNRLTKAERRDLVREECLVLALERDLIPSIVKAPMMIKVVAKRFLDTSTSNTSALRWLSRLSTGLVKDHPSWVTAWTLSEYEYVMEDFNAWWKDKVNNLPVEFWTKVLELRNNE